MKCKNCNEENNIISYRCSPPKYKCNTCHYTWTKEKIICKCKQYKNNIEKALNRR